MGLDAVVRCNCFRAGLAPPPPVPITLDDAGLPAFESYAGDGAAGFDRYCEWLATCCPHPTMVYADEPIAGLGAYTDFLGAVGRSGRARFPTLLGELPVGRGGRTPATASAAALGELARVRRLSDMGEDAFLVDAETGEVVYLLDRVCEVFVLDAPRFRAEFVGDALAFLDRGSGTEVIRAVRLRQEVAGSPGLGRGVASFANLDTGEVLADACPVVREEPRSGGSGELRWDYPRLIRVERRVVRPALFLPILEALERAFRASVETGNPVEWH